MPATAQSPDRDEIFSDAAALTERLSATWEDTGVSGAIRGSRERGLVVHKLLEEVLTGETAEQADALETRSRTLLVQLGTAEAARPEEGPNPKEMAATVLRTLAIPDIAASRERLVPELTVFSAHANNDHTSYMGGVVDALARQPDGSIELIIDWKTDVVPSAQQIELYRDQVRDYLDAAGAPEALLVFVTTGQVIRVRPRPQLTVNAA
jgi:exodeoxyribonuclease-5